MEPPQLDGSRSLKQMLDDYARTLITSALLRGRTVTAAAQLLHVGEAPLYRRMERLGIVLAPYQRAPRTIVSDGRAPAAT